MNDKYQVDISVIMAVYNTKESYLRAAIESILAQTYKAFEFIIVDDGSNQETMAILDDYRDSRIKILHNHENVGLTKSLNVGLNFANGKYIARMDADDISYLTRLEKQYKYMEKHKDVDILGAWVDEGEKVNRCGGAIPTEWRKVRMLFGNYGIVHSTAFIRNDFLKKNDIKYDEKIKKSQDYKLWTDCLRKGAKINVFPEILVSYRVHEEQISCIQGSEQMQYAKMIRKGLIRELYPDISERELQQFLFPKEKILNDNELTELFYEIERNNQISKRYNQRVLHYELIDYWKNIVGKYKRIELGYCIYRILRSCAKHR